MQKQKQQQQQPAAHKLTPLLCRKVISFLACWRSVCLPMFMVPKASTEHLSCLRCERLAQAQAKHEAHALEACGAQTTVLHDGQLRFLLRKGSLQATLAL